MPYEIALPELLVGFSLANARGGEQVPVETAGFATTEDAERLIRYLDAFSSNVFELLPEAANFRPSRVESAVAILERGRRALVYLNDEVRFRAQATPKRKVRVGESVLVDDLAEVRSFDLCDINVPEESGVIVILSHGWRKAVFFDLHPLSSPEAVRRYPLGTRLAEVYSYLVFQDRLGMSDAQFDALGAQGWFPFVSLGASTLRRMLQNVKAGWSLDEFLRPISDEMKNRAPMIEDQILRSRYANDHGQVLLRCLKAFREDEHIVWCGLLYPRLEGVLRAYRATQANSGFQVKTLVEAATAIPQGMHAASLLLPERFAKYLHSITFQGFDPVAPKNVSRHSVSHGVAPQAAMDLKASLVGLLTLEQILYLTA